VLWLYSSIIGGLEQIMNIVNENDSQKLIELPIARRYWIKNEIRKLKSQNKKTFRLIKFCNKDFSNYKKTFGDEILLYEELLEELQYTKKLLKISVLKNTEKIDNYTKLLSLK